MLANALTMTGVLITTFCNIRNMAKVISNTFGLQNVKYSSISVSVAFGLAAVVLNPVYVT